MNKMLLNFIKSFHEINPELTETIAKKFVFVFMEGEYDISFVFSANDIIKDIVTAIRGRDGVHSAVHLAKSGYRKWFDSKYPNRISFLESANKSVII